MKTGIELIAQERREQIEKHGHTIESDVEHNNRDQIMWAVESIITDDYTVFPASWEGYKEKIQAKSPMGRLIIAGALIAAEIDRLNSQRK